MSDFVTLECNYCGNTERSSFIIRENEYICKCCGRAYRENPMGGEMRAVIGFETLKNYDFEGAENIFSDIISEYPESIEARWGLLLARYGIVFVKGFYMGEVEPIYCFPNYAYTRGTFTAEKEYREIENLLAHDGKMLEIYRAQAKQIENAFETFKSDIGKKENDVFICVKISKTTANNPFANGRTEDYEKACELYGKLRERGKRVFFSYVTLKNTIDSDMEIWRNMIRSKKMLLIGSRTEYFNSVWVKSEWERWVHMDSAGDDEHKKNLYIYVLGSESDNLYSKLPAGLKKLHPQIYTESTEADLMNDICEGGKQTQAKKAKAEPKPKPEKAPAATAPKPERKPKGKSGYIELLNGKKEELPFGESLDFYSERRDIVSVVLPESVTEILKANFSECANLEKIYIPESVTRIEAGAFTGCSKLTSVEIPEGITEIEPQTFYMCKKLSTVKLPKGLQKIGAGAFMLCKSLKSIDLPIGLDTIGDEAFHSTGLKRVCIPRSVLTIGERAFAVCEKLGGVTLTDTVDSIGADAFDRNLKIVYSGERDDFDRANKTGIYYSKVICKKDASTIKSNIKIAVFVLAILVLVAAAAAVSITVKGSLHWCIAIAGGLALNITIGAALKPSNEAFHTALNVIELISFAILFFVSLSYETLLIYAFGIVLGGFISTIYTAIIKKFDLSWVFAFIYAVAFVLALLGLIFDPLSVLAFIFLIVIVGIIGGVIYLIFG